VQQDYKIADLDAVFKLMGILCQSVIRMPGKPYKSITASPTNIMRFMPPQPFSTLLPTRSMLATAGLMKPCLTSTRWLKIIGTSSKQNTQQGRLQALQRCSTTLLTSFNQAFKHQITRQVTNLTHLLMGPPLRTKLE